MRHQEKPLKNINPFTNEIINHVAEGDVADVEKAVAAANRAFHGEWGQLKVSERLKYIHKIADLIDQHIEEIAPLESLDTGLPISQTKKYGSTSCTELSFLCRNGIEPFSW